MGFTVAPLLTVMPLKSVFYQSVPSADNHEADCIVVALGLCSTRVDTPPPCVEASSMLQAQYMDPTIESTAALECAHLFLFSVLLNVSLRLTIIFTVTKPVSFVLSSRELSACTAQAIESTLSIMTPTRRSRTYFICAKCLASRPVDSRKLRNDHDQPIVVHFKIQTRCETCSF